MTVVVLIMIAVWYVNQTKAVHVMYDVVYTEYYVSAVTPTLMRLDAV